MVLPLSIVVLITNDASTKYSGGVLLLSIKSKQISTVIIYIKK